MIVQGLQFQENATEMYHVYVQVTKSSRSSSNYDSCCLRAKRGIR